MLATLTKRTFDDREWIFESKFDGVRCLAWRGGKDVSLYSRNRIRLNPYYPEIARALASEKSSDFIVDGEIVAFKGPVTSFSELQKRMKLADPSEAVRRETPVYYYLFDLIYLNGKNVAKRPLLERKKLLEGAFRFKEPVRYSTHLGEKGKAYYREACRRHWEGLI